MMALLLSGCGTKKQIAPKLENPAITSHQIRAKFASKKDYMKKYLPQNIILDDNAEISVVYEFADNSKSSSWDGVNLLFNPLILVGFPNGNNNLSLAGNLKFFSTNNEIKFSSLCISQKSRSLFVNSDFSELRRVCIPALAKNLENQINLSFEKGEVNVFK